MTQEVWPLLTSIRPPMLLWWRKYGPLLVAAVLILLITDIVLGWPVWYRQGPSFDSASQPSWYLGWDAIHYAALDFILVAAVLAAVSQCERELRNTHGEQEVAQLSPRSRFLLYLMQTVLPVALYIIHYLVSRLCHELASIQTGGVSGGELGQFLRPGLLNTLASAAVEPKFLIIPLLWILGLTAIASANSTVAWTLPCADLAGRLLGTPLYLASLGLGGNSEWSALELILRGLCSAGLFGVVFETLRQGKLLAFKLAFGLMWISLLLVSVLTSLHWILQDRLTYYTAMLTNYSSAIYYDAPWYSWSMIEFAYQTVPHTVRTYSWALPAWMVLEILGPLLVFGFIWWLLRPAATASEPALAGQAEAPAPQVSSNTL